MSTTEPLGAQVAQKHLAAGTLLSGTYEIVSMIGCGGMGAVYEARHVRLAGRRVAIKTLLSRAIVDDEIVRRFRREAEICAQLTHPNIVSVNDWDCLADGTPYLVMEYLEGEGLDRRLKRGKLAQPAAIAILHQACDALAAAHARGIIHRDIKPANIFLVGDVPHVKLLDFGISKISGAETLQDLDGRLMGSPGYMSPEQIRGCGQGIDARSDQFSLATVAYEMLAGVPAFAGDHIDLFLFNVVHTDPQPLRDWDASIPAHVNDAIQIALAKDPAARFASITQFADAIEGRAPCTPLVRDAAQTLPSASSRAPGAHGAVQATASQRTATPSPASSGLAVHADEATAPRAEGGGGASAAPGTGDAEAPLTATQALQRVTRRPAPRRWRNLLVYVVAAAAAAGTLAYVLLSYPDRAISDTLPTADGSEAPAPVRDTATSSPVQAVPVSAETHAAAARGPTGGVEANAAVVSAPSDSIERLRPEVERKLQAAEGLFVQGRYLEAVRVAQQSLAMQESTRARSLIVVCHCALGDLGNANAALRRLPAREVPRCKQRCREVGLAL